MAGRARKASLLGVVATALLVLALTACDPTKYTLTLASSPSSPVAVGSTVTFSGKLTPARSGGTVVIERSVNGTWKSAGTTTLSSTSRYSIALRLSYRTTYRLRARWAGPNGSAATSSTLSITTATVPGASTGLTASAGDGQAPLTFTAPASGGAAITSYQIQSPQGSVGLTQGGASQATATGLTNGTTYTFQLRACNAVGCGPWSASSNAVTPYGNPAAPTVSVSVSSSTTLTWTWNQPGGNGRPIDHFEITLDGTLVDPNFAGTSFAQTFGYSETHTLRVVAVNTAGLKSAASQRSGTTAAASQTVTVSKGASAVGVGDCVYAGCAYVRVTLSGLSAGSHTVECWSDITGASAFHSYVTSSTTSENCWFGYPGQQVWVVVDGVESNHLTW